MDVEAADVASRVFGRHYGKPLADAVWAAQNEVYGGSARRPYVVSAVYPQRLRVTAQDTPKFVGRRLEQEWRAWSKRVVDELAAGNAEVADSCRRVAEFHRVEAVRWHALFGGETLRPTSPKPRRRGRGSGQGTVRFKAVGAFGDHILEGGLGLRDDSREPIGHEPCPALERHFLTLACAEGDS